MLRAAIVVLLLLLPLPAAAQKICDQFTNTTVTGTLSTVERVPGIPGKRIYICGYMVMQTSAGKDLEFELLAGTGLNCSINPVSIIGPMTLPAQTAIVNRVAYAGAEKTPAGTSICVRTFGSGTLTGAFYWTQF